MRKPKAQVTKNRDRATIGERKVRDHIRKQGIACERTGLVKATPSVHPEDEGKLRRPDLKVSTLPHGRMGVPIMVEVKTRTGLKWLFDAFKQGSFVFLNTDREDPVVCMSMDQFGILFRAYYHGSDGDHEQG